MYFFVEGIGELQNVIKMDDYMCNKRKSAIYDRHALLEYVCLCMCTPELSFSRLFHPYTYYYMLYYVFCIRFNSILHATKNFFLFGAAN